MLQTVALEPGSFAYANSDKFYGLVFTRCITVFKWKFLSCCLDYQLYRIRKYATKSYNSTGRNFPFNMVVFENTMLVFFSFLFRYHVGGKQFTSCPWTSSPPWPPWEQRTWGPRRSGCWEGHRPEQWSHHRRACSTPRRCARPTGCGGG
jgi:hypothetical protein